MTENKLDGLMENTAATQRQEDFQAAEDLGKEYQTALEGIKHKEDWPFEDAFLSLLQGILSLAFRRGLFREQTPEAAAAAHLLTVLQGRGPRQ